MMLKKSSIKNKSYYGEDGYTYWLHEGIIK